MNGPWDGRDARDLILLAVLTVAVRLVFVSLYGVSAEEGDHAVHVASLWAGRLGPEQLEATSKAHTYLSHRRTQLLYPVLLYPMAAFEIPQKPYLFVLQHGVFACAMVVGAYGLAREWLGRTAGVASGAALALYLPIMRTASWAIHDTLFYAMLTLFFFAWALAQRAPRKAGPWWAVTAVALLGTRPEGWLVLLVSAGVLCFRFLRSRWGLEQAAWGSALVAVAGLGLLIAVLAFSGKLRQAAYERVACSFHVSWALFLSTHTLFNDAGREGQREMQRVIDSLPPDGSVQEAFAREGLSFIVAHPWRYAGMAVLRAAAILFPAPFRPSWAPWRRIYDAGVSVAVFLGVGLACRRAGGFPLLAPMLLAAGGITAFITFWGIGGDARHQNAVYVLLIPVAAVGWVGARLGQGTARVSS